MNKVVRRFVSLGFATRKAYRKMATAKPSIFIVASVVAAVSIFLLGGGIYDILEKPLIAIPYGSRILFFYPGSVFEQTILDSLYAMITYFMGAAGILLTYQSTKYAYKSRQAYILLLVGALFLLIAYFGIENLIGAKLSPISSS